MSAVAGAPLAHLGVLRVAGADARRFLQGQLSCDLDQLSESQALFGSVNSAQGRVQAVLTLVAYGEDVLLIAPAELQSALMARLKPYVLRAKIQLSDASPEFALFARFPDGAPQDRAPIDCAPGSVRTSDHGHVLRWWGDSRLDLRLVPTSEPTPALAETTDADLRWRAACIAAGVAQVWRATSGSFVAQMLNLEILGAISFRKGCYTGQEIIARAHYRGAVKRRMMRFAATGIAPVAGQRVVRGESGAGEIVDAVQMGERCELLAVVGLADHDLPLALEGGTLLEPLTLPYELPAAPQ